MKKYVLVALLLIITIATSAQNTDQTKRERPHIYNPLADARADIDSAIAKARLEHKNVMLQIGGNWCIWCIRFNDEVESDPDLNNYLHSNYVVVHVNYSAEKKNEKILAEFGFPQRFGFPVFVVLDNKGNRIHTQNSAYLEEGNGHSKKKILEFFKNWSPAAIDPKTYQ